MAQFRQLDTDTWNDRYFHGISSVEKFVYLYLRLNSHVSVAGSCYLPFTLMVLETGLRDDTLKAALDRLEKDGKIKYQDGWLAVRDAADGKGPKIKAAINTALSLAPPWVAEFLESGGKDGDPRASHPAIAAVRDLLERFPKKDEWTAIIEVLGEDPDTDRLSECHAAWSRKGYSPWNYAWIYDWYHRGIPQYITNGKRSNSEILSEYAEAFSS